MTPGPEASAAFAFSLQVHAFYSELMLAASEVHEADSSEGPTQGGKLLYAAELDTPGRALVIAGNVAGCASLAATADAATQKQAIRDGVVDFLVTSLDEALRILKNEIRKRETVAVCVGAAPEAVEREMLERGVLPDLLRPAERPGPSIDAFVKQGARRVETNLANEDRVLVAWQVTEAPARWLPHIDAIALECLPVDDLASRRWLRLAPRYMGRLAQGMHVLARDRESAERLVDAIRNEVDRENIPVPVEILVRGPGPQLEHRLRFERS